MNGIAALRHKLKVEVRHKFGSNGQKNATFTIMAPVLFILMLSDSRTKMPHDIECCDAI